VQKIVGSIVYYARAVDMTVLMALSTTASEKTKGTEQTMEKALQILDFLATHPDATIRFHATDMVMNIHSYASLSADIKSETQSSYRHPLIVEVPPSAGHSDQHRTFLPPKEQIVTSYW
jgi:hypothetical protein